MTVAWKNVLKSCPSMKEEVSWGLRSAQNYYWDYFHPSYLPILCPTLNILSFVVVHYFFSVVTCPEECPNSGTRSFPLSKLLKKFPYMLRMVQVCSGLKQWSFTLAYDCCLEEWPQIMPRYEKGGCLRDKKCPKLLLGIFSSFLPAQTMSNIEYLVLCCCSLFF